MSRICSIQQEALTASEVTIATNSRMTRSQPNPQEENMNTTQRSPGGAKSASAAGGIGLPFSDSTPLWTALCPLM